MIDAYEANCSLLAASRKLLLLLSDKRLTLSEMRTINKLWDDLESAWISFTEYHGEGGPLRL